MQSIRLSLPLLCLALLAPGGSPQAQPGTPGRQQLERLARGLETLQARFEQRVMDTGGAVSDQSEGRVWLSKPHFFRWEYGGEFPEVVVADGERVWIHDIELEQVTVKPQSDLAADSPLTVLTDIDRLDQQFEVREAGDVDGMNLLELRPIEADSEFDRVLLGLQDDVLQLMAMEDAFGLRTEIRFFEVRRNEPLDAVLFAFTPPPGADVIGDAEGDLDDD